MTDIDTELNQLRERQEKLRRLIALRSEVSSLELTLLTGTAVRKMLRVIAEEVCASMSDVRLDELLGTSRPEHIVRPRQIVYYLARRFTKMSYQAIGDILGGRDHGTVMHGDRRIKDLMSVDKPFAALVEQIRLRAEARLQEKPEHEQ